MKLKKSTTAQKKMKYLAERTLIHGQAVKTLMQTAKGIVEAVSQKEIPRNNQTKKGKSQCTEKKLRKSELKTY